MGQFTSVCPKCGIPHYWFLFTPDVLCKCGYLITSKEMGDIWHKECREHQEKIELANKKEKK